MLDILLNSDHDLRIKENGDIDLTESKRQAVKVRLLWFLAEWRFSPQVGIPYYEIFLVKNPNIEHIRRAVRDEVMTVEGVLDVNNITINIKSVERAANIALDITVAEETYREEVTIIND